MPHWAGESPLANRRGPFIFADADAPVADLTARLEAAAALQPTIHDLRQDVAASRNSGSGMNRNFEQVDEEMRLAARTPSFFLDLPAGAYAAGGLVESPANLAQAMKESFGSVEAFFAHFANYGLEYDVWSFIAGHSNSGERRPSSKAVRKSSARPWAARAMRWAVAGATTMSSGARPSRMWSRA